MARSVLITGGLGFLGSNLVPAFADAGFRVRVLDKNQAPKNLMGKRSKVDFLCGDYRDLRTAKAACQEMDLMIHLAWNYLPGTAQVDRLADIQENIVCSTRLFEEAAKGGVKTIFFASSGGTVYGPYDRPISERDLPHPICAYGVSKLTTEHYLRLCCREFDVQGLALRFGNPYGRLQNDPNRMQGAIEVFLNRLIANEPIHIWGDGHIVRDYFHVQDLVAAVEGLANHKVQGFDVFNVGSGTGHSLLQILSLMAKITGLNPKISFMSPRAIDVPISILDISKLQNVTGWRPRVGLEEGIRKEWQRLWQNARNGKRG